MRAVYDKINSITFKEEGDKGTYICSCCGKMTTLSDSVSSQGYNLVCNRCRYMLKRVLGIEDEIIKIQAVGNANRLKDEINDEYKDGPFTLTDEDHYFVLMADHKYNDETDLVEYSGMHHATKDSARMELAYAMGDDWGDYIKSIEIMEV